MATDKQKLYIDRKRKEIVAEFIAGLQDGKHSFVCDWRPGEFQAPHNPVSGVGYKGINLINLARSGYSDPRWMTYNHAKSKGYQVKKGATGSTIIFWTSTGRRAVKDESGRPVRDAAGNPAFEAYRLSRPVIRVHTVFNATQIDGIEAYVPPEIEASNEENPTDRNTEVKNILAASNAAILHDQSNRAYYNKAQDEIHLPPRAQFNSEEAYLATAMHELGHWTGHESRLNRELADRFDVESYAKEELRAEFFSFLMNTEYDIGYDIGQHKGYIQYWVKMLKEDPQELFRASQDAEEMVEFVQCLIAEKSAEQKTEAPPARTSGKRWMYLDVPYTEKGEFWNTKLATGLPANYDRSKKKWRIQVDKNTDLAPFQEWFPSKPRSLGEIEEEFGAQLAAAGLVLPGPPVMDGQIHRVPVEGSKPGKLPGAYCGYLDGVPAGWYQNFTLGEKTNWKAGGKRKEYRTLPSSRTDREAEAKEREQAARKAHLTLTDQWGKMPPASADHEYLAAKEIGNDGNLRQNQYGSLVIPIVNADGEIQSSQWISKEGKKGYTKYLPKQEGFSIAGSRTTLAAHCQSNPKTEAVYIAEGWATAKTISTAMGAPVVVAFDTSNLENVARIWREKQPDAKIYICGDNDRFNERGNVGKEAAEKAAKTVDGYAVTPHFPPASPGVDFNDLQSSCGLAAVRRQIGMAVTRATRKAPATTHRHVMAL